MFRTSATVMSIFLDGKLSLPHTAQPRTRLLVFFDRVEAGLVGHEGGNKANQLLPVT